MEIPLVSLQEVVRQQWFAPFWKISQEKKLYNLILICAVFKKKERPVPNQFKCRMHSVLAKLLVISQGIRIKFLNLQIRIPR